MPARAALQVSTDGESVTVSATVTTADDAARLVNLIASNANLVFDCEIGFASIVDNDADDETPETEDS